MTKPTPKKLSRRDAIKILGAAVGASVLANLPSKWSKPELAAGVLPAHAQTSIFFTITNGGFTVPQTQSLPDESGEIQQVSAARSPLLGTPGFYGSHFIEISPVMENIPLVLVTSSTGLVTWNIPAPDGIYFTDASGKVTISPINVAFIDPLNFTWSFQSPYTGTGATFTRTSVISA